MRRFFRSMVLNFPTLRIYGLVAGVPFLLAVVFAMLFAHDRWVRSTEAVVTSSIIQVAQASREIVHEAQLEYTYGSAVLAQPDPAIIAKLSAQQARVDQLGQNLGTQLNTSNLPPHVATLVQDIQADIAALDDLRAGAVAGTVSVTDIQAAFADIYEETERLLVFASEQTSNATLANMFNTVLEFERAKTSVAFEQSVIARVLGRKDISREDFFDFIRFAEGERSRLGLVQEIGDPRLLALFAQQEDHPAVRSIEAVHEAVLDGDVTVMPIADYVTLSVERLNVLRDIEVQVLAEVVDLVADAKRQADLGFYRTVLATVTALLLFGVFAVFMVKTQEQVMGEVVRSAISMASGNLDVTLPVPGKNGFSRIIESLGTFRDNIRAARDEQAERAAREQYEMDRLRRQSEEGAARSVRIAENLESTAQSVGMLAKSVQQSVSTTESANMQAADMLTKANEGNQTVQSAVEAMGRIKSASEKINSIIKIIDEIAFQTNLLALNARVEAARAGEAGRGFAVVATEVQQLAARSAKAAGDVAILIDQAAKEVATGVQIVEASGSTLNELAFGAEEIASLISTVANMNRAQSTSLTEISSATGRLDTEMQELMQQMAGANNR